MVSKLTVKLIAAASSLALLAGGPSDGQAKSDAALTQTDRTDRFVSGELMQGFLAQGGTRDAGSATLAISMLLDGMAAADFARLADLTRDLRTSRLPEDVETAAVEALIDGVRRHSGRMISADEAALYTGQVFDAHVMPVQVADAGDQVLPPETPVFKQVAAAGDTVGITDMVQRQARGILENNIRELVIEDNVFFQEVVETGPDSALRITLLDQTSLTLGPSSRVILDEFVYDPDAQDGRLAMRLISGVFRFTSGLMPKSRYSIDTPVGDIGIRGTTLDMYLVCDDQAQAQQPGSPSCELVVDVEVGEGTLNHPAASTNMLQGERLTANTNRNEEPRVEEIPESEPPLPQVVDMRLRVTGATIEMLEGLLPGGSIANANADALSAALNQLINANPNISDLLVDAIAQLAPARLNEVLAQIALSAPSQITRVAQSAASVSSESNRFGSAESSNPPSELTNDVSSSESEQSPPPYNGSPQ